MPEAGFQATNAFTGENTLHIIGRRWFHYQVLCNKYQTTGYNIEVYLNV